MTTTSPDSTSMTTESTSAPYCGACENLQRELDTARADLNELGAAFVNLHAVVAMHQGALEQHREAINTIGPIAVNALNQGTGFDDVELPTPVVFDEPEPAKPVLWTP